jgi:peptide/nickel transport system ATP-binding protein
MSLLEISGLAINYVTRGSTIRAVNGIDLSIDAGRTLGLVGETGAGKTTTALGILGLVPVPPGKIVSGQILFDGEDLLRASPGKMRMIRGNDISMIYQDPMTALNPILRVGDQIAEAILLHSGCSKAEAKEKSEKMLETVGIRAERAPDYPHQLSGGMKQRVVIAMALACNPRLLIADEPTTALDVTIQAQVLEMMRELRDGINSSMLLITHDLGIVAETCDDVAVMYAGEIVEIGSLERIFHNPRHPYTLGLFGSIPSIDKDVERLRPIKGLMPDPANLPEGCAFFERCAFAEGACSASHPELLELEPGHGARCLRAGGGVS